MATDDYGPTYQPTVWEATEAEIVRYIAQYLLYVYGRVTARRRMFLGTATGGTMEALYAAFVQAARGVIDPKKLCTFGLDEYLGLPPGHNQRYDYFMAQHLGTPLGLPPQQVRLPDALNPAQYDEDIRLSDGGGIDVQLLGIGKKKVGKPGGHAGFNEHGSPRDSKTRIVDLTLETREANARFFPGGLNEVPTQAVTMGIDTIIKYGAELFLIGYDGKEEAIRATVEDPLSPDCPSTFLRLHKRLFIFGNPAALSTIRDRSIIRPLPKTIMTA